MNTKYGIVTMVCAVAVYLALQFIPDNLVPWRSDRDAQIRSQIEVVFIRNDKSGLFAFLKQEFPIEYDAFLAKTSKQFSRSQKSGDDLRQAGFLAGRDFTLGLRRKNAHFLSTAPIGDIRAIFLSTLTLLESLRTDQKLCARFVASGTADFTRAEAEQLDLELMSQASLLIFKAIVAGRDRPQAHEAPRDSDWAQIRPDWESRSTPSDNMKQALYNQELANPDYCEAAISFQRFIATDQSPGTVRVLVANAVAVTQ